MAEKKQAPLNTLLTIYFYHTRLTRESYEEWKEYKFPGHILYGLPLLENYGIHSVMHKCKYFSSRLKLMFYATKEILFCKEKYDVLYATSFRGIEPVIFLRALGLYRKPIVIWHHTAVVTNPKPWREQISRLFYKGIDQMFLFSRKLIQDSQKTRKAPSHKLKLIHWGPDLPFYDHLLAEMPDRKPEGFISTGKENRGIATQSIVYVAVNTACYWHFTRWRPSLLFNFTPIKEMFGFSGKLLVTNVFNHINNNLFSVILGKFYTEKEVGYYNQANKWCGMGQLFISGMINGVAQPVLTKVSDDLERQKRVFRKMLRFTAFVSFPAMLGLGIVSEELITITITDKWYSSISIMQILCISGAFTPIAYLYQQLIISKGKSRIYMWNTIALGIILLSGVLLVHSHGIYTMLAVYVSTNILWLLTWHYFVWQEIGLKLRHALIDILPYAVIATTVMVITYYSTRSIENIYLRLASKIVLAAALYVAAMWGSRSVTFKESIQYFIKKKPHEP